jgi:hypothetical protein
MSISQHAERILAAWNVADCERFEMELDAALSSCRNKAFADYMEMEQQELLETVVERLRLIRSAQQWNPTPGEKCDKTLNKKKKQSAQGLDAGFALLQHLSHRAAA